MSVRGDIGDDSAMDGAWAGVNERASAYGVRMIAGARGGIALVLVFVGRAGCEFSLKSASAKRQHTSGNSRSLNCSKLSRTLRI